MTRQITPVFKPDHKFKRLFRALTGIINFLRQRVTLYSSILEDKRLKRQIMTKTDKGRPKGMLEILKEVKSLYGKAVLGNAQTKEQMQLSINYLLA